MRHSVCESRSRRWLLRTALLLSAGLVVSGCDPGIFRKPVADVKAATTSLRAVYFAQLADGSAAYADREVSGRRLLLWTMGPTRTDPARMKEVAEEIAAAKAKSELKPDFMKARMQAFDAVGNYLDVLAALAADDANASVMAEANGLVKDMQALLDAVKRIQGAADLVGNAERWSQTVGAIVPVFSEVFRLVGAIARYQAIRDMSRQTQDAFASLMELMGTEADKARELTLQKLEDHARFLEGALARTNLADDAKGDIVARLAELRGQHERVKAAEIPSKLFAQLAALHSRLVALDQGDLEAYARQIKSLRQRIEAVRDATKRL